MLFWDWFLDSGRFGVVCGQIKSNEIFMKRYAKDCQSYEPTMSQQQQHD